MAVGPCYALSGFHKSSKDVSHFLIWSLLILERLSKTQQSAVIPTANKHPSGGMAEV